MRTKRLKLEIQRSTYAGDFVQSPVQDLVDWQVFSFDHCSSNTVAFADAIETIPGRSNGTAHESGPKSFFTSKLLSGRHGWRFRRGRGSLLLGKSWRKGRSFPCWRRTLPSWRVLRKVFCSTLLGWRASAGFTSSLLRLPLELRNFLFILGLVHVEDVGS